jgi:hypothetical protein
MHFRRKRIVHFVVQQVAALLADGNELAYSIVFFFKPYCCHKSSKRRNPSPSEARRAPRSFTGTPAGWRNGANHGETPHTIFCLNPSAPRRSIAAGPVRRPMRTLKTVPAAKYIDIDAFNGKTVTRKTLLRYTLKSPGVNLLIRGNVWKKAIQTSTLLLSSISGIR